MLPQRGLPCLLFLPARPALPALHTLPALTSFLAILVLSPQLLLCAKVLLAFIRAENFYKSDYEKKIEEDKSEVVPKK